MQNLKSSKKGFENLFELERTSFDRDFNPSTILNIELREFLATPRKVPHRLREEIAEVLIYELLSGKSYEIKDEKRFIGKFGAFYPVFLSMRNQQVWEEIKILAGANRMAGIFILRTLLEELFTLLEDYEKVEKELFRKSQKGLEKALKALKELINETQALWEKNRLERNESLRNYEWQRNLNEFQERKGAEESNQSSQGSFLKRLEDRAEDYQDQESEDLEASEKIASMTREFMFSEKAVEAVDLVTGEKIATKLEELISLLEDHLEMLEILSMLFPGRAWDHSLQALHREYFENLDRYASLFRKSSDLHEILEQVGRIELEYGSKRLRLSPHSKSEVHTVTFSGDIQTLLPIETVKLKNPVLKRKFYADMIEEKLLTYQLRGENWNSDLAGKKRKGPVVALVDTSASMRGAPELLAKAVVLAIARRMLRESRDVKVILFSSKWQTVEIELTDKKRMGKEFLEFLKYTFGGGTDFNTALRAGLKAVKEEKVFQGADLLFLTDGSSELSERPLIREWNEIKVERKARIFSLIIGNYDAGGLDKVSDHTYIIHDAGDWQVEESPARFIKSVSKPARMF
ncbi:vWA domain-containing protein [Methanosarcina sp.]|uniref:vWA domain-containing protein n=1 Tax=Methanosarcina sp. TaxID=2213 RepID=UPI002ABB57F5|nr:VWA domain-containing protein [Methanosarcina sp.]MDY9924812.1 VWA domain-containing protein [Methanosarcina sp.]